MQLLNNASATGGWERWPGGTGIFEVIGTFGGATVSLQYLAFDGVTPKDMGADTSMLAAGAAFFIFRAGLIRAAVSGGAPSGLSAQAERVE